MADDRTQNLDQQEQAPAKKETAAEQAAPTGVAESSTAAQDSVKSAFVARLAASDSALTGTVVGDEADSVGLTIRSAYRARLSGDKIEAVGDPEAQGDMLRSVYIRRVTVIAVESSSRPKRPAASRQASGRKALATSNKRKSGRSGPPKSKAHTAAKGKRAARSKRRRT